jgi:hypothetical protein
LGTAEGGGPANLGSGHLHTPRFRSAHPKVQVCTPQGSGRLHTPRFRSSALPKVQVVCTPQGSGLHTPRFRSAHPKVQVCTPQGSGRVNDNDRLCIGHKTITTWIHTKPSGPSILHDPTIILVWLHWRSTHHGVHYPY